MRKILSILLYIAFSVASNAQDVFERAGHSYHPRSTYWNHIKPGFVPIRSGYAGQDDRGKNVRWPRNRSFYLMLGYEF